MRRRKEGDIVMESGRKEGGRKEVRRREEGEVAKEEGKEGGGGRREGKRRKEKRKDS